MNYQPTIDALNAQIEKLTSARDALQELNGAASVPVGRKKKSTLSAAGRKRIAAQRARWAEQKRKQRSKQASAK